MKVRISSSVFALLLLAGQVTSQTVPDPSLLAEINKIKAIDNHAHPMAYTAAGEKDPAFDVAETIPPHVLPVPLRPDNPAFREAWRMFYGYTSSGQGDSDRKNVAAAKQRAMREKGEMYPSWILNKLGIETMFANRVALGRGQAPPRFRWVPYANPFLFPLDNSQAKLSNPQRESDFNNDELQLRAIIETAGLRKLPAELDEYLERIVIPTLQRYKQGGAVAVKYTAAYQRSLDFEDVSRKDAERIYSKYIGGGVAPAGDYKLLQDYLFRRIAAECGRLKLPVHIHVGIGEGGWFYTSTADPNLLDSVLNDPKLRNTTFVLVHGGLPFTEHTKFLLNKPNVYTDFSAQTFLTTSRELSMVLRSWLSFAPEKVMFGSDAYPMTTSIGWEEIAWLSTKTGRTALAIALTGMMRDGEISRSRALEIARLVMHDNAANLYGLK